MIEDRAIDLVAPVAEDVRGMAAQAEAERRLPEALMVRLKEAGLFSIYTPREFGGLELPLPEALRVVEEVSRHDGSTGWTVALGIANGYFTSVLDRQAAARVLGKGAILIAGAPAMGVRAQRVAGGYRLTGRWPYNSGAPNADWIGAPAPVFDGDAPILDEAGQPGLVFFFIPPGQAQIIDTWYVTGLRATGTQDLYVEDVFVPEEMTGGFALPGGPLPVRECVLARIPLFSLLGLAQPPPVCLGLARRAIEEFRLLALAKQGAFGGPRLSDTVQAQAGLARAEALVRSARCYWYEAVEALWESALRGRAPSLEELCGTRIASLTAAEHSVAAADLLYRLAGTSAIFQSSPLERCWRDVHTAAQHLAVQDGRWETAGRVLFGLDPASPIV
ncbi:MAG TPA: acyl-CoA dehydrogenase family protein [Dehalococcoidia bacterium]|nr:acyl-CoA dehydrogenase family protein [Dehalococcoidia bacterium]